MQLKGQLGEAQAQLSVTDQLAVQVTGFVPHCSDWRSSEVGLSVMRHSDGCCQLESPVNQHNDCATHAPLARIHLCLLSFCTLTVLDCAFGCVCLEGGRGGGDSQWPEEFAREIRIITVSWTSCLNHDVCTGVVDHVAVIEVCVGHGTERKLLVQKQVQSHSAERADARATAEAQLGRVVALQQETDELRERCMSLAQVSSCSTKISDCTGQLPFCNCSIK